MKKNILFFISLILMILCSLNVSADNAPNVSLINPTNNQIFLLTNNITFNCSTSDDSAIANVSLWHNINGIFALNQTRIYGEEIQPQYESNNVLLFHFNNNSIGENSTYIYDWSKNGNNGTAIGVNFNSTGGKFGGAFEFYKPFNNSYSQDESIVIPDSNGLDLTTQGTIELWIKVRDISSSYSSILSKGDSYDELNSYALWLYPSSNKILAYFGDGINSQNIAMRGTLNVEEWYYLAVTWDSSNVKIYLNGLLNNSEPQTVIPFNSANVLRIGKNTLQQNSFNGTIDEFAIYNRTLTPQEIILHASQPNNISQIFTINNIPDGEYIYNFKVYDNASQSNISETNYTFSVDVNVPIFNNVTISPNSVDEIDPGITINVTANISELFIDSVILQYKQSSIGSWTNITMSNTSTGIYNASFSTGLGGDWDYRVWANDTNGYSSMSNTFNLSAEYDYTWTRNPTDFNAVSGFLDITKSIGVLIINNTGEFPLRFDLSSNWENTFYNLTEPFDLNAKNVTYINVSTTFQSSSREDNIVLTISSTSTNANPSVLYTNATLVSYAGGAYLSNTLINYLTKVNQSHSINLYGSVKNIGNETALNATLSWIMPNSYWTNISGNMTNNLGNLTIDSTNYNNITINVSSSVAPGAYTLYLNSTCNNSNVACSDSESFTIYVYCYSGDGVCGEGCSYESSSANYDSECSAPSIVTSSGGGGGGGIVSSEKIAYSKIIEIVRGEQDGFNIEVRNRYSNSSLENLTLSITGFLSQYVSIIPERIDKLKYNETKNFTVTIKAPSYKGYEEHTLQAVINGYLVGQTIKKSYTETQNILLIIQEINQQKSNLSLTEAEKSIQEMEKQGFNVVELKKLLNQAKENLANKKNKEAYDLSERIIKSKETAFKINELINMIQSILKRPRMINLITGNSVKETVVYTGTTNSTIIGEIIFSKQYGSIEEILNMAIAAFKRGDYDVAKERIDSIQTLLLLEKKGNFKLFLYLNWYWIIFWIILFSFTGILGYKQYQRLSITNRIEDINKEEENIGELTREIQKDYFSGKLSIQDYNRIKEQHSNKLNQIRKTRLMLRNRRINLLKPQQIVQDLNIEKMQIESEIKKIQEAYFKYGKISKEDYELQFNSLNERLAEIEEERITLQILEENKREEKIESSRPIKLNKMIKKLKNVKNRKDKRGAVLVDNGMINKLKEELKGKDCSKKWIKINLKEGKGNEK